MKGQIKNHTVKILKLIFLGFYEYDSKEFEFKYSANEFNLFNEFIKNHYYENNLTNIYKRKILEYNSKLNDDVLELNDSFISLENIYSMKYNYSEEKNLETIELNGYHRSELFNNKRTEKYEIKRVNHSINDEWTHNSKMYFTFTSTDFDRIIVPMIFNISFLTVFFSGFIVYGSILILTLLLFRILKFISTINNTNNFILNLEYCYIIFKMKWIDDNLNNKN